MTIKVEKLKAWPWLADSRGTHSCQCVCLGFNKDKTLRVYACPCVLVYSSSVSSGTTLVRVGEMSAHPSTWHLQSRLLSVSLFTSFSFIRLRYSELFLLLLTSLALFLSHAFFVVFFFHSFKSLTSLSLLISFPFTAVILFPSFSPVLSVDTEIHLICVSQNRADGNLFFSVCVCFTKNNQMLRMWLPFKKALYQAAFLAEQSTFKSWKQLTFFTRAHVTSTVVFIRWSVITKTEYCSFIFIYIYVSKERCARCWFTAFIVGCQHSTCPASVVVRVIM